MKRTTTGYLLIMYYITMILVHLLVVAQLIPYKWVNGGLSPSYEYQAVQSVISILVLSIVAYFVYSIHGSVLAMKEWKRKLLYVLTALTVLGLIMQLMGTSFERFVIAPIVLVGFALQMQLVIKLRKLN